MVMMIKKAKTRRGFNLVEAAIVLGVVGLVIGGIWVAAAAVQSNLRKSEASKGLIQIVQNVRNLYYGQTPSSTGAITNNLISANAIPGNFVSGTGTAATAINPWNGSITVGIASSSGSANDLIDVSFQALPKDACIELTSRNTNISSGVGLSKLTIGTVVVTTFPYLPTTAATDCAATNTVVWTFGLRG